MAQHVLYLNNNSQMIFSPMVLERKKCKLPALPPRIKEKICG
jgi:hypothetical protein